MPQCTPSSISWVVDVSVVVVALVLVRLTRCRN